MKHLRIIFFLPCFVLAILFAGTSSLDAQEVYVLQSSYQQAKAVHIVSGSASTVTLAGNSHAQPQGLALNQSTGKLYWVDAAQFGAQVRTSMGDLSVQDSLYPGGASLHALYGIVVDAANGLLYWTSSDLATKPMLYKSNLDGSARTAMDILPASYGMTTLRGLALDPVSGTLYISSDGTGQILRYTIGTSTLDTLLSGLRTPVGVAINHGTGTLYWTESVPHNGSVRRADLANGANVAALYEGLDVPNYIQIDAAHNVLYWTEMATGGADGGVYSAQADGSSPEPNEVATGLIEPSGLVVLANYAYVDLNVSRHCIQFATLVPGDTREVPLTIYNQADSAGLIDSIVSSNGSFHAIQNHGIIVPAGNYTALMVSYNPASPQADDGILTIYSGTRHYDVWLSGNAKDAPAAPALVYSGTPFTNGSMAPSYTELRASRTNGELIRSTLTDAINGSSHYSLTIGAGEEGIAEGDTIVFTEIGANCDTLMQQMCENTVIFHVVEGEPPVVPLDIHGFTKHTQTINMARGYNAVSWSMVPPDPSVAAVFAGPLSRGSVKVIFRYANDGTPNLRFEYYIPALGQYNPLQKTSNTEGYFVKLWDNVASDAFSVTGLPVCDGTPIYLNPGYNLVSYLAPWPDLPANELWSLRHDNLHVALGYENDTVNTPHFQFYPDGDLTMMTPSVGYFLNVFERDTLTYYGFGTGKQAPRIERHAGEKTAGHPRVSAATGGLPQAVFLYGLHVKVNGTPVPAGTTVDALTLDGQNCGTGKFAADGVFSLAVTGDDPSTELVEGVRKGEVFRVVIGGKEVDQRIAWKEHGDTPVLDGNLLGVAGGSDVPKQFVLEQNYPNPFNPTTTIRFGIPYRSAVSVTVYAVTGQKVAELYNGIHDAGYTSLQWNSSGVASGVYYYRIDATAVDHPDAHFSDVRKMLLLR